VCLDYVLPIGLPFSLGASLRPFSQELFNAGMRPAYHINLDSEIIDFYLMYPFNLYVSSDDSVLHLKYGAGAGIRIRLKNFFFVSIETGPSLESICLGVSIKLN
jgi:hypothetical protein